MKKIISLLLTLTLCMALCVPALADSAAVYLTDANGTEYTEGSLPAGISYDAKTFTLTLNGLNASGAYLLCWRVENLVLAEGSKNTISYLDLTNGFYPALTIKGSGELIITGTHTSEGNTFAGGSFYALDKAKNTFALGDGLTMTGGPKEGDTFPVKIGNDRVFVTESGQKANYIRIAPAAGSPAPATPAAPATTATISFTDVPANSPFKDAINWAVEKNITKGITATTFGPGNKCTISHILTFLYRASGASGTKATEKENVMEWATTQLGAPGGGWEAPCNRVMAVDFIWRAAGCPEPTKAANFTDLGGIDPEDTSFKAIAWAVEKGITTGTSATTFSPDTHCTRGQIVTFLYRASK